MTAVMQWGRRSKERTIREASGQRRLNASLNAALTQPSRAELRAMLAEAAANTAKVSSARGAGPVRANQERGSHETDH